ncbi:MAG: zinc ribbon domain-containing protein, partial [Planctomycetia bacterium]|nr:zinc ribbon domain-containing protein [Planctomycetia bacterium]
MKKCPKCQREIPDYAQQCPFSDCGADVSGTLSPNIQGLGVSGMSSTPKIFTGVIPAAPPVPGKISIPSAPPIPGNMRIPPAPPIPGGINIPSAPPVPGMVKKEETERETVKDTPKNVSEEKVEELPSVSSSRDF